jgi:hypothetical protein
MDFAKQYLKSVLAAVKKDKALQSSIDVALRMMNADTSLALPPGLDLPYFYGIDLSMTDALVEQRVLKEMPSIWNKCKRNYPFCARLKSIHDLLVERSPVTNREFWRDQVKRAQEIRAQRLHELAQAITADSGAAAIGAIERPVVGAFAARAGVDPEALIKAVEATSVRVVLPLEEPPIRYNQDSVRRRLASSPFHTLVDAILGIGSTADLANPDHTMPDSYAIVGGFRPLGGSSARIDLARAIEVRDYASKAPTDDAVAVSGAVRVVLDDVDTEQELQDALLMSVIDYARQIAISSPRPQVLAALLKAHVAAEDAARIVLHTSVGSAGSPVENLDTVREHVAAHELVAARAVWTRLVSAGADLSGDGAQSTLMALAAEERSFGQAMERFYSHRDTDVLAARNALRRAIAVCSDDDEAQRLLDAMLPSPPRAVSAEVESTGVVVLNWREPAEFTGEVSYRVLCRKDRAPAGPRDGELVAKDIKALSVEDSVPVCARPLYYGVVAVTQGRCSSPETVQTMVLPAPASPCVRVKETSADVTWELPRAALSVEAQFVGPDGQSRLVRTVSRTALSLSSLNAGERYVLRLRGVYSLPDGTRRTGESLELEVVPHGELRPVVDLAGRLEGEVRGGRVRAVFTWTTVPGAEVRLYRSHASIGAGTGMRAALTEIEERSVRILGAESGNAFHRELSAFLDAGAHRVAAVVVDGDQGLYGNEVVLAAAAPVTGIHVDRLGPAVKLSWVWPDGDYTVRLHWSTFGSRSCREVRRAQYDADGGVVLPIGDAGGRIDVTTVPIGLVGAVEGVTQPVTVPARSRRRIAYHVKWRKRILGAPSAAVFSFDDDRGGPFDVWLVVRAGRHAPSSRDAEMGTCRRIDPGSPKGLVAEFPVPQGRGTWWAKAFAAQDVGVKLVDPPMSELKGN